MKTQANLPQPYEKQSKSRALLLTPGFRGQIALLKKG
jgi:hypothetical protein